MNTITQEQAINLYHNAPLEELISRAGRLREALSGKTIDLCSIMNVRSGSCSEDCRYCAQSAHYPTEVEVYESAEMTDVLKLARENETAGVKRFSLVTSGRNLEGSAFDSLIAMIKELKAKTSLYICASIGFITIEQALKLKTAGLNRFHNNLETSRNYFPKVCTTHTYNDKIDSIRNAQQAGLSVCSGGILGLGETAQDRLDMAFTLRDLGVLSIPLNLLNPIPNTPMENTPPLQDDEIIRTLALFRIINPVANIRLAGGRIRLGDSVKTAFKAGIDGLMVGNYLTTIGNKIPDDLAMITSEGYTAL